MRIILYTHSLASDWNHGNAHFLRGLLRELQARGHKTLALEPANGWSRANLIEGHGQEPVSRFHAHFPDLDVQTYDAGFDHASVVETADVVLVHEWTDPALVAKLGRLRRQGGRFTLLFHDTHHRAVSDFGTMAEMELADYDAVLAFGEVLRQRYLRLGWGRQAFTWHEAADTALFHPQPASEPTKDLVWIGNWGDGERADELAEFLINPARQLGLTGTVRGVRYPAAALDALSTTKLHYGGWLANIDVPGVFAQHRMTIHVPRRPYLTALPGIPTIRVFEALACGIPLVSAPWDDAEGLFNPGDFLRARDGVEMADQLRRLREDSALARQTAAQGLATIRARHTCAHRVDELFAILETIKGAPRHLSPAPDMVIS